MQPVILRGLLSALGVYANVETADCYHKTSSWGPGSMNPSKLICLNRSAKICSWALQIFNLVEVSGV